MSQLKLLEQAFATFDETVSREFYQFMGDNEGKTLSVHNIPCVIDYDFDSSLNCSVYPPRVVVINKLVCEKQNYHFLTKDNADAVEWDIEFLTPDVMYSILMDILRSEEA